MTAVITRLNNLPLGKKLTVASMALSLISLIIAISVAVAYERYDLDKITRKNLEALTVIIINNNNNNNNKNMYAVNNPFIELTRPIIYQDKPIDFLYLLSANADIQKRSQKYSTVFFIASFIFAIIAFILVYVFAIRIPASLLGLEKTARIIAEKNDYSIRAVKRNNDDFGNVVDAFNSMLDVIQREDAYLRESEEKFRLISQSSKVGIFQLDTAGEFVYANEELSVITNLSNKQILQDGWLSAIHDDDRSISSVKWQSMLKNNRAVSISCRLFNSGDTKWINGDIGLLKSNHETIIGYLGTIIDITEVKNAQIQLEQMAFYDTLTGLANRRLFRSRLEHVINNFGHNGNKLGLILIDLDHFKNVNDSLGHDAGDTLLIVIAERLQECIRASDTVARLGGDEFAIILPGIQSSQVLSQIAQKILATLKLLTIIKETEIRITASIGLSLAPDDSNNAETLVKNADMALYFAKGQGRDNYQFFTQKMDTDFTNNLTLIKDLRTAIDRQEFRLVFQPQIDIKHNKLVGFESLIRWHSSSRGHINPVNFIPTAEDTGLIIPIGRWVIATACKKLRSLYDQQLVDHTVTMTVNLSVKQFQDDDLVVFIASKLSEFDLKPGQFEVELTETLLMENLNDTLSKLDAIKALGVIISIDDFGTGYSSLGYLKRLPVDIVKVDRSFVNDIPHDKDDMEITAAVIAMAHGLNYKVVAEGVETPEQLAFLKKHDCDYAQGYLFSKPLSEIDLIDYCKHFSAANKFN